MDRNNHKNNYMYKAKKGKKLWSKKIKTKLLNNKNNIWVYYPQNETSHWIGKINLVKYIFDRH